jgi:hypothetical protein
MQRRESERTRGPGDKESGRSLMGVSPMQRNEKRRIGIRIRFHRLVTHSRPKLIGLFSRELAAERLSLCEPCSPVDFSALLRLGRRKCGKSLTVASNGNLLAILDPFGEAGEVVAQLAHGGCFHCDTTVYHRLAPVKAAPPAAAP